MLSSSKRGKNWESRLRRRTMALKVCTKMEKRRVREGGEGEECEFERGKGRKRIGIR